MQQSLFKRKADASGISLGILKKVFDRGVVCMEGWTPPMEHNCCAMGSCKSKLFISGGKTRTTGDADLWKQHKGKKRRSRSGGKEVS